MTKDSHRVSRQTEEPSQSSSRQAEESSERRLARESREYRTEIEQLRRLILHEWDQRKIPLNSLSEMINGLNRIIEGLDRIPALKDAQKSVREARADLNAVADVVELLENPLSPDLLKALPDLSEARYKYYDSCADFLQKAVVQLDTFLNAQEL